MNVTIDMPAQEIEEIKRMTRLQDEAKAITQAAREYLRAVALRELKTASGKVDFDLNWPELENLEQRESTLPR